MATSSTGAPTFTARTMTKGELALAYGLKKPAQLKRWCIEAGITLPDRVHYLCPALVATVIEKLGAPTILMTAARM